MRSGVSLPVLYRQYVDLVEPEGVQFLDFGEDPEFSGCVDGLVMLDLASLKPAKRARYLGKGDLTVASVGLSRAFGWRSLVDTFACADSKRFGHNVSGVKICDDVSTLQKCHTMLLKFV